MKVALAHELLTMKGGAERVLQIFADMFPDAPIYTLLYDEKTLGEWFPRERVRTPNTYPTRYSLLPHSLKYNHHLYLNQFSRAVESFDFSAFDLVLSSSSAFMHGMITNSAPKHVCYVHAPARYLWDRTHDVRAQATKGPLGCLKGWYMDKTFHKLRTWDAEVAARPDKLLAASKAVQNRIQKYWRRESDVVYPPIADHWIEEIPKNKTQDTNAPFLIVSSLVQYKRIDIAIEACNQLGVSLQIAGSGPDRKRLEAIAGPTIEFLGYVGDDELPDLYTKAKAVIFPGDEDFGLVPLEAMACGTPVIAHRTGGALETIREGETGLFFEEANPESLRSTLEQFAPAAFDAQKCHTHAAQFSRTQFEEQIRNAIN